MINQTPCAVCGEELTDDARLLCKRCEQEAQSISTKDFYLRMISRPDTDARFLNSLRADINADDTLHGPEKDELFTAINNKFAVMNAAALPPSEQSPRWVGTARCAVPAACSGGTEESVAAPVRRGCKHLIIALIIITLSSSHALCCFAAPTPAVPVLVPTANGDPSLIFSRRLAALSLVESGDNDNAVGRAGEISRFQILPSVFAKYFFVVRPPRDVAAIRLRLASRNPFTAWNIARSVMQDRCNAFAARFHRPPSDFEFYVLWARPSWLLMGLSSTCHHRQIVTARAQRFSNLCNRNP